MVRKRGEGARNDLPEQIQHERGILSTRQPKRRQLAARMQNRKSDSKEKPAALGRLLVHQWKLHLVQTKHHLIEDACEEEENTHVSRCSQHGRMDQVVGLHSMEVCTFILLADG